MKIVQKLIVLSVTALLICLPGFLFAQTDVGCDPLCNCRADGSICPIDSSLWVLLAFGLFYGVVKIVRRKKEPAAV